jgi:hypothetical protein
VDCSDMPGVESSSEAPSHLIIPVHFFPSLAKIVVNSDVFIHFSGGASPRSVVDSLQNIVLWVLVQAP